MREALDDGLAALVTLCHKGSVINSVVSDHVPATVTADARLIWTGDDDRRIELEIVALDLDDAIVVVHVMPTALRREPR